MGTFAKKTVPDPRTTFHDSEEMLHAGLAEIGSLGGGSHERDVASCGKTNFVGPLEDGLNGLGVKKRVEFDEGSACVCQGVGKPDLLKHLGHDGC